MSWSFLFRQFAILLVCCCSVCNSLHSKGHECVVWHVIDEKIVNMPSDFDAAYKLVKMLPRKRLLSPGRYLLNELCLSFIYTSSYPIFSNPVMDKDVFSVIGLMVVGKFNYRARIYYKCFEDENKKDKIVDMINGDKIDLSYFDYIDITPKDSNIIKSANEFMLKLSPGTTPSISCDGGVIAIAPMISEASIIEFGNSAWDDKYKDNSPSKLCLDVIKIIENHMPKRQVR